MTRLLFSQVTKARRYKGKRFAGRLLLLGSSGWVLWTIARSRHLLAEGRTVARHSQSFSRDYFVGDAARRLRTYLVLGDSTAAGWGARQLAETYPYQIAEAVARRGFRVHVVNVAVGGARLHDVLNDQVRFLKTVRPQLVSLSIGANDATHFTSDADYTRDLKTLISQLRESTANDVLLANTPDMFQAPALPWPLAVAVGLRARRQNALWDSSLRDTSIHAVDLFHRGKLVYKRDHQLYARDMFHPSAKGYGIWAKLFIEAMKR